MALEKSKIQNPKSKIKGFTLHFFQKSEGFTLIETIISTVLIAVTLMSLGNIFVAGKRYIQHSRSRIAAGEFGLYFLDPLQMQVRQDTWNQATNDLSITVPNGRYCDDTVNPQQPNVCPSAGDRSLQGITYAARYDITNVTGTNLRKVQLKINWTEFTP